MHSLKLTQAIETLRAIPVEQRSLENIEAYHRAWVDEKPDEERKTASERELELWKQIIEARDSRLPRPSGFCLLLNGLKLTELTETVFDLGDTLEELNVNNNSLSVLPDRIGDLSALKELCVSDNKLPDLPDRIGELRELKLLHVSSNALRGLARLDWRVAQVDIAAGFRQ
ncbi:MAG: hypothetical protein V4568_04260 [Pseudomonadota bacterium]